MKKALLIVSFGTAVESARKAIAAAEAAVSTSFVGVEVFTAYTSPTIRRILAKRGERTHSLSEALTHLAQQGYDRVAVQPTHLIFGYEYDKMAETVREMAHLFQELRFGKPLLSDLPSLEQLCSILNEVYPRAAGEAMLLLGHGTGHSADMVYPAMQTVFRCMGVENVFLGTVEGWLQPEIVLAELNQSGYAAVHLVPLLLVAGTHAISDMAGDNPASWSSRMAAAGYSVRCTLRGLGELGGVQDLYRTRGAELYGDGI